MENYFKTEKKQQTLTSPPPDKPKSPWHSPRLDVLNGSDTEAKAGAGPDRGGPLNRRS